MRMLQRNALASQAGVISAMWCTHIVLLTVACGFLVIVSKFDVLVMLSLHYPVCDSASAFIGSTLFCVVRSNKYFCCIAFHTAIMQQSIVL